MLRSLTLLMVPAWGFAAEPGLPSLEGSLVQMILGLLLILLLIAGAAWLLRRFAPLRGGQGVIKVLGGLALGSRERVVLLQVGETRLLLGVGPGRVQTLHVFDPANSFAADLAAEQLKSHERGRAGRGLPTHQASVGEGVHHG